MGNVVVKACLPTRSNRTLGKQLFSQHYKLRLKTNFLTRMQISAVAAPRRRHRRLISQNILTGLEVSKENLRTQTFNHNIHFRHHSVISPSFSPHSKPFVAH